MYKKALIFIGGAVTGSLVSWYFTKKKYETLAENEIAKMREGYRQKNKELAERARIKTDIYDDERFDLEIVCPYC